MIPTENPILFKCVAVCVRTSIDMRFHLQGAWNDDEKQQPKHTETSEHNWFLFMEHSYKDVSDVCFL